MRDLLFTHRSSSAQGRLLIADSHHESTYKQLWYQWVLIPGSWISLLQLQYYLLSARYKIGMVEWYQALTEEEFICHIICTRRTAWVDHACAALQKIKAVDMLGYYDRSVPSSVALQLLNHSEHSGEASLSSASSLLYMLKQVYSLSTDSSQVSSLYTIACHHSHPGCYARPATTCTIDQCLKATKSVFAGACVNLAWQNGLVFGCPIALLYLPVPSARRCTASLCFSFFHHIIIAQGLM